MLLFLSAILLLCLCAAVRRAAVLSLLACLPGIAELHVGTTSKHKKGEEEQSVPLHTYTDSQVASLIKPQQHMRTGEKLKLKYRSHSITLVSFNINTNVSIDIIDIWIDLSTTHTHTQTDKQIANTDYLLGKGNNVQN